MVEETAPPAPKKAQPQERPLLKLAVDLGPLAVFFAVNARLGIIKATAAFMVAFFAAMAVTYLVERKLSVMPMITGAVVLVFGGLTLYLNDDTFIKLKPTIIYALFSAVLLGGLAAGRPLVRLMFGPVFHLDDEGWRKLTLRWGLFFAALAALNEVLRHILSTNAWVAVKVWGFLPLTVLFTFAQLPLIRRHALPPDEPQQQT